MRWRRAEDNAWATSVPMDPSRHASAHWGNWRSERPRRTRRLAAALGTRQRVAIHEAAVFAPSAAHSSPISKAAVASVTNDSRRESSRCSLFDARRRRHSSAASESHQRIECVRRTSPTPWLRCKHGVVTHFCAANPRENARTSHKTARPFFRGTVLARSVEKDRPIIATCRRTRHLRVVLLLLGIIAFAAADAAVKGHHGGTRNAIGNVSATWALVPFLAAAVLRSRRVILTGAIVGALSTALALGAYALVRTGLCAGARKSWRTHDGHVRQSLAAPWSCRRRRTRRSGAYLAAGKHWNVVVAVSASLLVMEPLARLVWAFTRHEGAGTLLPSPTVWAVEIVCGCLVVRGVLPREEPALGFALIRITSNHVRTLTTALAVPAADDLHARMQMRTCTRTT